ncbi:MAG TPA: hypothetical protein VMM36_16835 [Opitutaceae bacterium]|nr:hypothetical protein [Opitutaceae bacterium]
MRFLPALAVALLPLVSVAQTDEWVRDDMTDESLWLVRTGNLAREPSTAGVFPGAPERGSQWVVSKGDGPAYVVYFLPGAIHEVEIDTHRLAGAAGDFTLAVSTDGKLYQPINAGSVLLDSSFGWDYRLMASDQIPENATHLLVQFPNGSSAHRLSEVWIRYTWDDARVNQFLPTPAAALPVQSEFSLQSDADLQLLLDQLMAQPRKDPAPSVDPLDTFAPVQLPSAPEPQATFVAPPPFEYAPALAQSETVPVVDEDEEEEIVETTEPAIVVAETTQPDAGETKEPGKENAATDSNTVAKATTPTIVADVPAAGNEASRVNPETVTEVALDDPAVAGAAVVHEESELTTGSPVVAEIAAAPGQSIEPAAGLLDASVAEETSSESGVTEIDVAEFSPDVGPLSTLDSVVATNSGSESIEPLAITAAEPQSLETDESQVSTEASPVVEEVEPVAIELVATTEPVPAPTSVSLSEETTPAATEVTEIAVSEFEASAAATKPPAPEIATPAEESTLTFDHARLALADADGATVPDVEVAIPELTPPELAPAPAAVAGTEPLVVADTPVIAQVEEPPPIAVSHPAVAIVELPAVTPPQADVVDPSAFADPEFVVEVAAIAPEAIADPSTADPAPEEPEQVWRLPPFDLPIMSASQARESAASNEESVPPKSEAQTVAQELPPAEPVHASTQEIAAAPLAVDPVATVQTEVAAAEPEAAAPESTPAAPLDSGPMLIAAAEMHAIDSPESEISEKAEPDRKPTMKVRRIGPRSKSRDSYSARS